MTDHVTAGVEPRFRIRCGAACLSPPELCIESIAGALAMHGLKRLNVRLTGEADLSGIKHQ